MALDVYVVTPDKPDEWRGRLQFNSDGYFWYLYDAFKEVAARTGQQVDLYEDATLVGQQLAELDAVLSEWRARVEASAPEWSVTTGYVLDGSGKERTRRLEDMVQRAKMLYLIDELRALARQARESSGRLCFVGD